MPADRLINVLVSATGTRSMNGRYIPGETTSLRTWCFKHDLSLEDVHESGGSRDVTNRRWRIRYDSRVYSTPTSLMDVLDGGLYFNVQNIAEVTDGRGNQVFRRRWIDIEGTHST